MKRIDAARRGARAAALGAVCVTWVACAVSFPDYTAGNGGGGRADAAGGGGSSSSTGDGGGALPAHCSDGLRNNSETDVDCGGDCAACSVGEGCDTGADCTSKSCPKRTCVAATCDDQIQNGDESDIDCGGNCAPCAVGKGCSTGADCASKSCQGHTCVAATCKDQVQDGDETDIDCGGSCLACANTKACAQGSDCESFFCSEKTCAPWATSIAAGDNTCALTSAGGVMCWGDNEFGQLGNNSTKDSHVPVTVSGLASGVKAVSASAGYSCALTSAGGVMCWGSGNGGELGNNSMSNSSVPVAVSGLASGVKAIATSNAHTCAVTSAGGVMCWGINGSGQLGNNSTSSSSVPVAVSGLASGVMAVSACVDHTCALTSAGGVMCWGYNHDGGLGDNSTSNSHVPVAVSGLASGVMALSGGQYHTCALTSAGGVMCWGYNHDGELGNNSTHNSHVPVAVSGLASDVVAISAGGLDTCALTSAGGVMCWGDNRYGQLGDNSTSTSHVPVPVDEQ